MVKLVDTLVSGTSGRKAVQVRVLFRALKKVGGFPPTFFSARNRTGAFGSFIHPLLNPPRWGGLGRFAPNQGRDSSLSRKGTLPYPLGFPGDPKFVHAFFRNGREMRKTVPLRKGLENEMRPSIAVTGEDSKCRNHNGSKSQETLPLWQKERLPPREGVTAG